MIRAHYTGRLASNGAVFDSSYPRGKPLQFKIGVGQVIKASPLGRAGVRQQDVSCQGSRWQHGTCWLAAYMRATPAPAGRNR